MCPLSSESVIWSPELCQQPRYEGYGLTVDERSRKKGQPLLPGCSPAGSEIVLILLTGIAPEPRTNGNLWVGGRKKGRKVGRNERRKEGRAVGKERRNPESQDPREALGNSWPPPFLAVEEYIFISPGPGFPLCSLGAAPLA